MNKYEETIAIYPGYDHRSTQGGIHGCEVLFVLKGHAGVLTFACLTDWLPKPLQEQYMNGVQRTNVIGVQPVPLEFVYHAYAPASLPNERQRSDCPYAVDGRCYTSNSPKTAEYLRDIMLNEGSAGIWREMETRYRSVARVMQLAKPRKVQL